VYATAINSVVALKLIQQNQDLSPEHQQFVAVLVVKQLVKRRPLSEKIFQTLPVTDRNQMIRIFLQCAHIGVNTRSSNSSPGAATQRLT